MLFWPNGLVCLLVWVLEKVGHQLAVGESRTLGQRGNSVRKAVECYKPSEEKSGSVALRSVKEILPLYCIWRIPPAYSCSNTSSWPTRPDTACGWPFYNMEVHVVKRPTTWTIHEFPWRGLKHGKIMWLAKNRFLVPRPPMGPCGIHVVKWPTTWWPRPPWHDHGEVML